MNDTKVKICGITKLQDAILAAEFGADVLGFNFCKESPRYIPPESASIIAAQLPDKVEIAGVFVNENLEEIVRVFKATGLDTIQLHGDETPEFTAALKRKTSARIIKAFRITPSFRASDVLGHDVEFVLLDSYSPKQRGGTGKSFDWEIAKTVCGIAPNLYLAGGLTPINVREAVLKVKPYAVDVCSGVEARPGVKDVEKLRSFIRNTRETI
ncbi:MAG: phosphoribosylanthranilate isomerase [Pyrinomonadaceae bacterium]